MTAEHLAANAPATLRWAIAGRSRDEVERVKARLVKRHASSAHAGTVLASLDDRESLQRMAAATRVLITTVGPFIDYGEPVVRACIEQGTDYIDITGEPNYVQLLLGRYAKPAADRGVRLVPSCGFEAIPADLGALFTVQQLPAGQPIELSGYLSMKATFSRGTEQRSSRGSRRRSTSTFQTPRRQMAGA